MVPPIGTNIVSRVLQHLVASLTIPSVRVSRLWYLLFPDTMAASPTARAWMAKFGVGGPTFDAMQARNNGVDVTMDTLAADLHTLYMARQARPEDWFHLHYGVSHTVKSRVVACIDMYSFIQREKDARTVEDQRLNAILTVVGNLLHAAPDADAEPADFNVLLASLSEVYREPVQQLLNRAEHARQIRIDSERKAADESRRATDLAKRLQLVAQFADLMADRYFDLTDAVEASIKTAFGTFGASIARNLGEFEEAPGSVGGAAADGHT